MYSSRRPSKLTIVLALYGCVATFFLVFFFQAFDERAKMMNNLTGMIVMHERANGCLSEDIDAIFWVGKCPYISPAPVME